MILSLILETVRPVNQLMIGKNNPNFLVSSPHKETEDQRVDAFAKGN